MTRKPHDLCPEPVRLGPQATLPLVPPIYPAAVYVCHTPQEAAELLAGTREGYIYSRDGHPNADLLSEKCRLLHGAEQAAICATGMGALSAALLALVQGGDHVVLSHRLYGRTQLLLTDEAARLGIASSVIDTSDLAAAQGAMTSQTRLVVVETLSNPMLRVADIAALAEIAHRHGAWLLVDNTFAGPTVCRPLELGADLVMESLTKCMNGHSDVNLGLLCGRQEVWERVRLVLSAWGLASSPFDCWLALRGLGTLAIRTEQACRNARQVSRFLVSQPEVAEVHFPGLEDHPHHALARRQFGEQFGSMVTFTLSGGLSAAERFIAAARQIPFSPSLGDISTTLSHPASTSHRLFTEAARQALGIHGGTIRLSVGIETPEAIMAAIREGLDSL